jgi:hypothetical protein
MHYKLSIEVSITSLFSQHTRLTTEQKQCPHGKVTGAWNSSPQMLHRRDESSARKPGADEAGGKSDGSGISEASRVDSDKALVMAGVLGRRVRSRSLSRSRVSFCLSLVLQRTYTLALNPMASQLLCKMWAGAISAVHMALGNMPSRPLRFAHGLCP